MNLYCKAYLPHEIELPEAVQRNANGDVVIIEVHNNSDQTCQVVFENDEHGDLMVSLRGKTKTVGTFKKELDAAKARDKFVIENNTQHQLNFPGDL